MKHRFGRHVNPLLLLLMVASIFAGRLLWLRTNDAAPGTTMLTKIEASPTEAGRLSVTVSVRRLNHRSPTFLKFSLPQEVSGLRDWHVTSGSAVVSKRKETHAGGLLFTFITVRIEPSPQEDFKATYSIMIGRQLGTLNTAVKGPRYGSMGSHDGVFRLDDALPLVASCRYVATLSIGSVSEPLTTKTFQGKLTMKGRLEALRIGVTPPPITVRGGELTVHVLTQIPLSSDTTMALQRLLKGWSPILSGRSCPC